MSVFRRQAKAKAKAVAKPKQQSHERARTCVGLVDSRPPPIDKLISQNAVQGQHGLVDRGQWWDAGRPAFVCPLGLSVANLNGTVSSRIEMRKFDNGCVLALRTY